MPVTSITHARPRRGSPSATVALVLILTCQLMIVLDASIVITALPKIQNTLHFSPTSLSWVQSTYTLMFGGFLLLGARIGDILGRRRVFMAGIGVFAAASLAGGLAQSSSWLLAARAVQGIAAAVAAPSTLALLMLRFPDPRERLRSVGLYGAVSGAGISVGLVLGGVLTDLLSWRWGLFVNVPIGIAVVALAPRYLPETERRPGRFDLAGAITSTLGMTALVYGFVRAASEGWRDSATVGSFAVGLALLAAFLRTEQRAEQPIMPFRLFASRERVGGYVGRLLVSGAMFSAFFFLTQYLQEVRDYSALKAGFAFIPMTALMFTAMRTVPRLIGRYGTARPQVAGLLVGAVGMAWLSRLSAHTGYFPGLVVPLVLLGAGLGTAFLTLTSAGIAGVEPADSGAASGLVNVSQQVGGSVATAVMVTVFGAASRSATHHPLAGASAQGQAHYVLAHAVSAALTGSAVLLVLALVASVALTRKPAPVVDAETVVETEASVAA